MRVIEPVEVTRETKTERRRWVMWLALEPGVGVVLRTMARVTRRPSGRGRWPSRSDPAPVTPMPPVVAAELRGVLVAQVWSAIKEAVEP